MIVPIYSIVAIAAVVLAKDESVIEFLEVFRTMYEAILIVSFFQLITAYACFDEEVTLSPDFRPGPTSTAFMN